MKTFHIATPLIVGLISIGFAGCEKPTHPQHLVTVADSFFEALQKEDAPGARDLFTSELARRTPIDQLERFANDTGLTNPIRHEWRQDPADGENGILTGDLFKDGAENPIPVRIGFALEGDQWKIQGIQRGVRVEGANAGDYFVPFADENVNLINAVTLAFAEAVNAGQVTAFWDTAPVRFRENYSRQEFQSTFSGFVEQGVNLIPATRLAPVLTATPQITESGILELQGFYPTEPSRVTFAYEFLYARKAWELAGIQLTVRPAR